MKYKTTKRLEVIFDGYFVLVRHRQKKRISAYPVPNIMGLTIFPVNILPKFKML